MTTMVLSHSHMTLQFTFMWQLWYCHIHIWLFNLLSYDNYDIVTFTYDSNLPSYDNYGIVTFTYNSPIYLHMTTMILSHSHMTPIYLHMTTVILSHSHMTSIYFPMTELQIKKNSCQTLGPASKRVLPDLSTFCQTYFFFRNFLIFHFQYSMIKGTILNKGNNKITELRTILQRESQNS
jgi:hypothetical protein